jgi:hypothetical protein
MNKKYLCFVMSVFLCTPFFSAHAGWFDWLPGVQSAREQYRRDAGTNLTAYSIEAFREKAATEQAVAIQVGKIHKSISRTEVDKRWFGDLAVTVKADYTATYGLPYDLIEKGIRIEKDYTTTGLVVIVSSPKILSGIAAVDTRSIYIENRYKNGSGVST